MACLGLVTYPAAFAAGARHLRRRTTHEGGGWREFVADFRAAVRGGWLVGLAGWAAVGAVWVDVLAVRAGIPGGPFVGAVGIFALIGVAVALLRATAVWTPGAVWRALLADAGRRTVLDPAGSFLVVCGLAVVALSALFFRRWRCPSSGPSRRRPSPSRSATGAADGRCPRTKAGASGAVPLSVMPLTITASVRKGKDWSPMSPIPRRSLLKAAAVAGAAAQFSWALGAKDAQAAPRPPRPTRTRSPWTGWRTAASAPPPAPPSACPGRRAPTRRTRPSRSRTPTARPSPYSPGRSPTGPTAPSSGPRTR